MRPEDTWLKKKRCPYCDTGLSDEDKIDDDTYVCPTCGHEVDIDDDSEMRD